MTTARPRRPVIDIVKMYQEAAAEFVSHPSEAQHETVKTLGKLVVDYAGKLPEDKRVAVMSAISASTDKVSAAMTAEQVKQAGAVSGLVVAFQQAIEEAVKHPAKAESTENFQKLAKELFDAAGGLEEKERQNVHDLIINGNQFVTRAVIAESDAVMKLALARVYNPKPASKRRRTKKGDAPAAS